MNELVREQMGDLEELLGCAGKRLAEVESEQVLPLLKMR